MLETARPLIAPSSLMIYESSLRLWGGSSFSVVKTFSDKTNLQSPLTKCIKLFEKKSALQLASAFIGQWVFWTK